MNIAQRRASAIQVLRTQTYTRRAINYSEIENKIAIKIIQLHKQTNKQTNMSISQ